MYLRSDPGAHAHYSYISLCNRLIGPATVWVSNSANPSVLFRVHPAIFDSCWHYLTSAPSDCLLFDYRFILGSIQLAGPKALAAILSVCTPCESNHSTQKLWAVLRQYNDQRYLPNYAAIQTNLMDPYIKHSKHKKRSKVKLIDCLNNWKEYASDRTGLSVLDLGTEKAPLSSENPYYTSGTLNPEVEIPALILKDSFNQLTLILPWRWVLRFWVSLNKAPHVMFGGQTQLKQIAFENGTYAFPYFCPATPAGLLSSIDDAAAHYKEFARKPRAKRLAYEKVRIDPSNRGEIGNPFACDWQYLATLQNLPLSFKYSVQEKLTVVDSVLTNEKSLTLIQVTRSGRGSIKPNARIYCVTASLLGSYDRTHSLLNRNLNPTPEHLCGYVIYGGHNLRRGFSTGVGAILTKKYEALKLNSQKHTCIIRNSGETYAYLAEFNVLPL
ncbi:hypothetical protein CANCADRAFT_30320 [Tortispora caseinolytica NRRL Y-17796]|uniref:Uncharacterized protein n=1 Tax=Tortispora caseinolytica NRRL Y-17796 TaxID=767744 RepID=A0A1E4TJW6_9ASCO|nr:hypothetical protein CANCADRAFT_30320 [Tortispora caseinolytica NRRL Y-17796]